MRWLIIFIFPIFGAAFSLKERLVGAENGDYLVVEVNQTIALLHICSSTPTTLLLEEIAAPKKNLKRLPDSWTEWVKHRAPGHTSWSMLEIDLQKGEIVECYSFSQASWIPLSSKESLLVALLQSPLKPIEAEKRRRIGSPPPPGEADFRQIWQPPLTFEGEKIAKSQFDAFETSWPQDGSEWAGKTFLLYFDRDSLSPFPYWIEVETSHASFHLRALDGGKHLSSLFRSLPRRIPEFIAPPQKTRSGLRLSIKSPKYYRQFELFAVDVTEREKEILPLSHQLIPGKEELLSIEISKEELHQTLKSGHRYTWLLIPTGHSESYSATVKPFTWE